MLKDLLSKLTNRWYRYTHRNDDKADTRDMGWDGKCSSCHRWMHRNNLVVRVTADDHHWYYHCLCGGIQHWNLMLAPVPILEGYTTPNGEYHCVLQMQHTEENEAKE